MTSFKYEMCFMYLPAFFAQVEDPAKNKGSTVRVWLGHPGTTGIDWNPTLTIPVDLTKTPSWAGDDLARWKQVQIDDYYNTPELGDRGFTTLGPAVPHIYGAGGIYLSMPHIYNTGNFKAIYEAIEGRKLFTDSAQAVFEGRDFERLAYIVRSDGVTRRFHGFYKFKDFGLVDKRRSMISVAHAGASFEERAPRLLLVAPNDKFVPKEPIVINDGTPSKHTFTSHQGEVFLSLNVIQSNDLDVPKKPSGSGDRFEANVLEQALIPNGPLNVFSGPGRDEVARIRAVLGRNTVVLDHHGLDELLDLATNAKFTSLDLIGHSSRDGALKLSEVPIVPSTIPILFHDELVSHLRALGIRQVRLLGCRTACGPRAHETAKALYERLNKQEYDDRPIAVVATRADIFAAHYTPGSGFHETRLLVGNEVLCNGAVGDVPPIEDLARVRAPLEIPPPSFGSISELPLAQNTHLAAAEYVLLKGNEQDDAQSLLKQTLRYVDMATSYPDTPYPPAMLQVAAIDRPTGTIRAFEIVLATDPDSLPAGTYNFDRVRLSGSESWRSYAITGSGPSPGRELVRFIRSIVDGDAAPADRVGPGVG